MSSFPEGLEQAVRGWKLLALGSTLVSLILLLVIILLIIVGLVFYPRGSPPQASQPSLTPQKPDSRGVLPPTYTNFCQITATPEELILDFGLNLQTEGKKPEPGPMQRIAMDYYTAKRLAGALAAGIQQHEKTFGTLELDVRKRMQQGSGQITPRGR